MNTLRKIVSKCNRVERVKSFGECWEWPGSGTRVEGGYGKVGFKGTTVMVHRLMYSMFVGDLDECDVVMHMCDNQRCCNPSHLTGGTHQQNALDASMKSRLPCTIGNDEAKLMRDMFAAGKTRRQLASIFQVSHAVVTETLCGKLHPTAGGPICEAIKMHGESHVFAKMNAERVRQIREMRSRGVSFVEIAKRFELHHSTVMDIVNRKTWRDVA